MASDTNFGDLTNKTRDIGYKKGSKQSVEHLKVPVIIDHRTTIYVLPENVEKAKEKHLAKLNRIMR